MSQLSSERGRRALRGGGGGWYTRSGNYMLTYVVLMLQRFTKSFEICRLILIMSQCDTASPRERHGAVVTSPGQTGVAVHNIHVYIYYWCTLKALLIYLKKNI